LRNADTASILFPVVVPVHIFLQLLCLWLS